MMAFLISMLWLLFFVALVGAAVWAIDHFIPMNPDVRRIFNALITVVCVVVIIAIAYWLLLWLTAMLTGSAEPTFPRFRP